MITRLIDLIYVKFKDGKREMSVAVMSGDDAASIGPAAAAGAIKELAPLVMERFPLLFESVADIENRLMFVHFKNMASGQNSAGQDYPFRIGDA